MSDYPNQPPINSLKVDGPKLVAKRTNGSTSEIVLPMTAVEHGAIAGTARPVGAAVVYWIGSVEPANGEAQDLWYDTSA